MRRARLLLPAANLVFFAIVSIAYVHQHGGVNGDYDLSMFGGDTVDDWGDAGMVFFNRWQMTSDESVLTDSFLILNLPAFMISSRLISTIGLIIDEFQSAFPFGVSYYSYLLTLALPFSLLQWFGTGLLFEFVRKRLPTVRPRGRPDRANTTPPNEEDS